ncbi:MAG: VCBS repeat-containing protein [Candidatus Hydrogenedentes bacterium]|nr:VCBS repeat-containing protein [Candidatus Hydrogenedentota bacterium]
MNAWLILVMLSAGAVFDLQEMPIDPGTSSEVTLADLDGTGRAGLAVASAERLVLYFGARSDLRAELRFPPETLLFDIADLNGDGQPDVIALTPDRVYSVPVPRAGADADPWRERFTLDAGALNRPAAPVPTPLVLRRSGRPAVLAVVTGDRLRLYQPDGTEEASYGIGPESPAKMSIGSPFVAVSVWPPQRDGAAQEWRVSRHWTGVPVLPDEIPVDRPVAPPDRELLTAMARRGNADQPETWPAFPLRPGGGPERVLFLYASDGTMDSLVRTRRLFAEAGREATSRLSTIRRYPGRVIPPRNAPPDFNHDGWSDLMLWSADQPTYTVGTLTRTLARQTWPIRVAVHLFEPDRNAFAAMPEWAVTLEVPLGWMMEALGDRFPARHLVCADFNGDNRVDMGLSDAPDHFIAWCSSPVGLRQEPSETVTISGSLDTLLYAVDLDRGGRTSLVFRTDRGVAVLRAR